MKNMTEETIGTSAPRKMRGLRREELNENEMPLLFLVPLVETAWAHGAVARREKQLIFAAAREEGIHEKHFLNESLDELLIYQPGREFFDSCLMLVKTKLAAMTVAERDPKLAKLISRCRQVAAAAGGNSPMDIDKFTSPEEHEVLTRFISALNFRDESENTGEQRRGRRFGFSEPRKRARVFAR